MSSYPVMHVGTDTAFQNSIGLLKFTLPALPVTKVDSAKLQLAVIAEGQTSPSTIVVNRATSAFTASTVTYNTKPSYVATASQITVSSADLYKNVQIDITDLVNSWLDGTYTNQGIALTSPGPTVQLATNAFGQSQYSPELILTYSYPYGNSAESFCYAQLSNVIKQLMALHPTGTMTVYTRGTVYISGTPYELYASPDATYGMLSIMSDSGEFAAVPVNNITAVAISGITYDPTITYLTPPTFNPGSYTNLLLSMHSYLPISTSVDMYLGPFVEATGVIYKNEYGVLVKTDSTAGNNPVFIPVVNINAVVTSAPTVSTSNSVLKSQSVTQTTGDKSKKIVI
jgi:hypothetical protein